MTPEQRAEFIEDEVKRYYMDKVAKRFNETDRAIEVTRHILTQENDHHVATLEYHQRLLNQIKLIQLVGAAWTSLLTCIVVFGLLI